MVHDMPFAVASLVVSDSSNKAIVLSMEVSDDGPPSHVEICNVSTSVSRISRARSSAAVSLFRNVATNLLPQVTSCRAGHCKSAMLTFQ